jgi:AcrR family transcriptional regulator
MTQRPPQLHASKRAPGGFDLRSVARPKQARSEESLRRLLDAAESLLEEKRFGEISIADIAKRARSSVGGFYARFRDKDELLLALHERFVTQLDARLEKLASSIFDAATADTQRFARAPGGALRPELRSLLRPALQLLLEIYRAHRGTLTAFASRAAENRRLWKAGMTFRSRVIARFTGLMLSSRDEIAHPDPELAAELAVQLALGFMEQTLLTGPVQVGGEPVPDALLGEELERILLSYLGLSVDACPRVREPTVDR